MNMLKTLVGLSTACACLLSGCMTSPNPPNGLLFSDIKGPNRAVEHKAAANKSGQACAQSVLGIAGWGDASIDAARRAGKISSVAAVDYTNFDVLGIVYTQTCTVVTGS